MADISLLFGVQREGGVGEGSDATIYSQLQEIVNDINKKPLSIKFKPDEESLTAMKNQIKEITNELQHSSMISFNSFGADGSSNNLVGITQRVMQTTDALHSMQTTISASNIDTIKKGLANIGTGISANAITDIASRFGELNLSITEIRPKISNLGKETSRVTELMISGADTAGNTINQRLRFDNKGKLITDLSDIVIKLAEVRQAVGKTGSNKKLSLSEEFKNAKKDVDNYYKAVESLYKSGYANKITETDGVWSEERKVIGKNKDGTDKIEPQMHAARVEHLNKVTTAYNNAKIASKNFSEAERNLFNTYNSDRENKHKIFLEDTIALEKLRGTVLNTSSDALKKGEKALKNFSAAKYSVHKSSRDGYDEIYNSVRTIKELQNNYKGTNEDVKNLADAEKKLRDSLKQQEPVIRANGDATKSFSDRVSGLAKKFTQWLSVSQVVMWVYKSIKQMISVVIELDTAMTELKKVTDESDTVYDRFLRNAVVRAKELGSVVTDVVTATADFARLGYSIGDAEQLADTAIIYKNVGDGIEDISDASESVIATMQAFNIEAKDAMSIVDKYNEVGNKYAISSKGVGDALLRSAAAMYSANNTLDETIALATAANTVVQDPEKVGTTLKTISMYLRAAKTEAEDAGESTDGMASSVSELRGEILSLTGNKVDIQIDENTFKNTFQIMKELSEVWDELSDVSQANILEMVGGKRNANVVAALLENFSVASKALHTSSNAEGSALAENEKYLDSIEGRIAGFKATFEELSSTAIDGNLVKDLIYIGNILLEILNSVFKFGDAIGGLKTALMAVGGVILTVKAGAIHKFFENTSKKIKNTGKDIKNFFSLFVEGFKSVPDTAKDLEQASGQISIAEYLDSLKDGAKAVEDSNKAGKKGYGIFNKLSNGFKKAGTSAKAASIGIGTISTVLTIATMIISGYLQSQEEARQAAADAVSEMNEYNQTLSEYKDTVDELRKELDAGNLSENEAYEARKKLLEIEDSLIEKFGKEAKGINLVTGEIEEQIGKIDELSGLNSSEWEKEHGDTGRAVADIFTNPTPWDTNWWGTFFGGAKDWVVTVPISIETNDSDSVVSPEFVRKVYSEYAKILGVSDSVLKKEISDNDGLFYLPNIKDIYELKDVYSQLYDKLLELGRDNWGENYEEHIGGLLDSLNGKFREVKKVIDDNEETFNTYVSGQLMDSDIYGDIYPKALAAQKAYNDAILDGDDKAAQDAVEKMKEVEDEFIKAGWSDEAVNMYMQDFFNKFKNGAKDEVLEVKIKTSFEQDKDAKEKLQEAVEDYTDESGKIDINKINNIGIDFDKDVSSNKNTTSEDIENYKQLKTAADKYECTVEELVKALNALNFINKDGDIDDNTRYHTYLKNVEALEEDLSYIDKIYADILDKENFDYGSLTDENFIKKFSGLGNVYDEFIKTVSKSPNDINACQEAFNKLTGAYLTNSKALESLSKLDKETAISMLEQIGIAESSAEAFYEFSLAKSLINNNQIETTADIDNLKSLAKQAGATAEYLHKLELAKSLMAKSIATPTDDAPIAEYYAGLAKDLINEAEFSPDYIGGTSSRNVNSSANSETWFDKQLKLHKHRVAMDKETQKEYFKWLNSARKKAYKEGIITLDDYRSYTEEVYEGLRTVFKDYLSNTEHEISMRQNYDGQSKKVVQLYKKLIKDVEKEIKTARNKGLDNSSSYIQELLDKWQGYSNSIRELQEEIENSAKDAVSDLVDYRIDMIKQEVDTEKEALDKKLDYLKEFYDKQKDMLQKQHDEEEYLEQQAEKRKTVTDLQTELSMLGGDTSSWAQKRRLELQEELAEAKDELEDFENDYAYDLAINALDDAYESQETAINQEIELLEDTINDPNALYNKALSDIQKTSKKQLYYSMLTYNRQFGDGNDNTVKDMWESAYGALNEYQSFFGKLYSGIKLTNVTNYKSKNGTLNKKVTGYASGTSNATAGLHEIFEEGHEEIFETSDGRKYKLFKGGEKVFDAKSTEFLHQFASSNGSILTDMFKNISDSKIFDKIGSTNTKNEISMGDIIVKGSADNRTVSEIRRAQRDSVSFMLKEFAKLNK